jgi:hypothetical protein
MNVAEWDCCDEHETTFPMGDECPKCAREDDPAPYCSYGHRTRESCDCESIAENE